MCHIISWYEPIKFYMNYIRHYYNYKNERDLIPTPDFLQADYFVVSNRIGHADKVTINQIKLQKTILHYYEPSATWKTWGEWGNRNWLNTNLFKFYDMESYGTIVLPFFDSKSKQWVHHRVIPDTKLNSLCFITTLYNIHPGHFLRKEYLDFLEKEKYIYDLYGDNQHSMIEFHKIDDYTQYKGKLNNKYDVLNNYKYTLAIENTFEDNWFSEKIWDSIICECLPFYWGCPNLEKFIPAESFIRLPQDDLKLSLEIIRSSIANNEWEKRREAIKEAKKLFLNKYDLISTLKRTVAGL